ncbi:microsomal signal peptidase 12kDa subunit [Syncephalastrum racemosum]|uniref:Signal peptidase complex subunit 1 n=1 Tax=Syncephalastrum racemosum TaxID=13706 RepID=A0A1X2H0Q1_SYNRA|nr:microsomal signal peptidase 12kDa subunit [Syncephalastrum racemosum]
MAIADYLEWTIDFEGQKLADYATHGIMTAASVIAFVAGFATQSLQTTLTIFAGATVLAALVVLPPWPMYNKHPLPWLPAKTKSE